MWYVYILQSKYNNWLYIGITNDLKNRLKLHNKGKVYSTRLKKPFKIIYYEVHTNKYDAAKREKFLKTGWGKNWIRRSLNYYFSKKLGG